MMENAGSGVADAVLELVFDEAGNNVLALVGPGNNGGDALVALAYLAASGWKTHAYLIRREPDNDPLVARLKQSGGEVIEAAADPKFKSLAGLMAGVDVVIDGVLGTGAKLPLKEDVAAVLDAANRAIAALDWPPYVVAVDCPSGVECDSGAVAPETIPASFTVCMAAVKQGLLKFPAYDYVGHLQIADIGLTNKVKAWAALKHQVVDDDWVESILPDRPSDAHKGTFGTALVAAGSMDYTGAALLAGKAAYRIGAGLVTLAVPSPLHAALAGQFPEATWVLLPHESGGVSENAVEPLLKHLDRVTALLIGPGFGTEETTHKFLDSLLRGKSSAKRQAARIGFVQAGSEKTENNSVKLPPLVVDADGLKLLAKIEQWPTLLPEKSVLTPHPGEMSVLTGLDKDAIQADRLGTALKFAAAWGHVVVLKGALSVIAAPDGRAAVVPVATPALARAGTGDVLAGLIVGLRAQGVDAFHSAVAGAWIHAQAGLYAANRVGNTASVLAGDVLDSVADVLVGLI
jgi:NAD(P)H-hydrate epimerase